MRKLSLLTLVCILAIFSLLYFQPSRAQDKFDAINRTGSQPLFSKATDVLKEVLRMTGNAKSAGAIFDRRELFEVKVERVKVNTFAAGFPAESIAPHGEPRIEF